MLYRILQDQINNQRYTLVFFNNIETMIKTFSVYKQKITKLTYVHSEDVFRFEKVEQLRNGHFDVIFTTTILERDLQWQIWMLLLSMHINILKRL